LKAPLASCVEFASTVTSSFDRGLPFQAVTVYVTRPEQFSDAVTTGWQALAATATTPTTTAMIPSAAMRPQNVLPAVWPCPNLSRRRVGTKGARVTNPPKGRWMYTDQVVASAAETVLQPARLVGGTFAGD
jgi:hypothetical protein